MKLRERVLLLIIVPLLIYILIGSCANTSTPPMGGPKDTIPPKLLKLLPDSGMVNFPIKDGRIVLTFDEYVVLAEEQKNIYLSPPQEKLPKTRIKGKSIVVRFEEPLDSNTTYLLHFGNSIKDNNEGNLFYPYAYPFSTSSTIDTMMISGVVMDSQTLLPAKGATIALYLNHSDSAVLTERPSAIAKSDDWGYFVVRNLKNQPYALYAFEDMNFNNICDIENETIAFVDSLITPTTILSLGMQQLAVVEEKDTVGALSRPKEIELYLFQEESDNQYIREAKREQDRMFYLSFAAPNPQISKLEVEGIPESSLLQEYNQRRDSLVVWLADTSYVTPDSIKVTVDYLKTDTLGVLSPDQDNYTLAPIKRERTDDEDEERRRDQFEAIREDPDAFKVKIDSDGALFEEIGFKLTFEAPLVMLDRDSIEVLSESARGNIAELDYEIIYDTLTSRVLSIMPKGRILKGYNYTLNLRPRAFVDIYKNANDSLSKQASLPSDDKLSSLSLAIFGAESHYIVELTNATRDRIYRSHRVACDTVVEFPYLTAGKYSIKVVEDRNGNGLVDTGSFKERRQPERVRLYTLSDGSAIFHILESAEMRQEINLREIFKDE